MRSVTIIGAGPAGLTAARVLAQAGLRDVLVLERNPQAGGLPRFCDHPGWGMLDMHRLWTGPRYAGELVRRAAGAEIATDVTVTALHPGGRVEVSTPSGLETIKSRVVLLATGIREQSRGARLVSGTRPWGVTTTGAFQEMAQAGQVPFRRPVVIGSELVAFSALLTARHAGIRPVAMIEPGERILARRPGDLVARHVLGVPVRTGTELVEIQGIDRVEAVILERRGQREIMPCDGVVFTGKFVPEAFLARRAGLVIDPGTGGPAIDNFFRCSETVYFAAGNLLRPVEHSGVAAGEGAAAAGFILHALRGGLPEPAGALPVFAGGAMRYVYPQRILPAGKTVQLFGRAAQKHQGRLRVLADETVLSERRVTVLPERRLGFSIAREKLDGHASLSVVLD
jgi:NADPH-dependent 2,4-dienoyl-CoA reductase/sulfur reductase-like enzyme